MTENVYDKIWELEHQHRLLCNCYGCNQRKIMLPCGPDAPTITQRKTINGIEKLQCYRSGDLALGGYCYFHTHIKMLI